MHGWINLTAVFQIVVAGLVVGAGLPALFSLGVRLNAEGAGAAEHGGSTVRSPLLTAPNVVLTPHIGAFTDRANELMGTCVVSDIIAVLDGQVPRHQVTA